MGLPVRRETISTPKKPRERSGCARMPSICFFRDADGFGEAAEAPSERRQQPIRTARDALLFNIYKPDCSTGNVAPSLVQLELRNAPRLHMEPRHPLAGTGQAH